jgi:hypothetical protein
MTHNSVVRYLLKRWQARSHDNPHQQLHCHAESISHFHPVLRKLQLLHTLPSYSLQTYRNSVILSLTYSPLFIFFFPETLGFKDAIKVITVFWV